MAFSRYTSEDSEQEETKFNFGLSLLKRIDQEFTVLEENLVYENYSAARKILESILNEIDTFLTDIERDKIKVIESEIDEIINSVPNIDDIYMKNIGEKSFASYVYGSQRIILKPLLINLDRLFRRLMKEKGLVMPPKSESDLF